MPSGERGERLQQLRSMRGWTQAKLSSETKTLERSFIAKIEAGFNQASSFRVLSALSTAFGCTPSDLDAYLGGDLQADQIGVATTAPEEQAVTSQVRLHRAVRSLRRAAMPRLPTEVIVTDDLVATVLPAVSADVVLVLVVFSYRGAFVPAQSGGSLCLQFAPLELVWRGAREPRTPHTPQSLVEGIGIALSFPGIAVDDAALVPLGEAIIASALSAP